MKATNQNKRSSEKKQFTCFTQPTSAVTFSDFSVKPVLGDDKIKKSCLKGKFYHHFNGKIVHAY